MPKLTLSVDADVVKRAKRHARKQGTSVSRMVEDFLKLAASPRDDVEAPPILRRLRGSLKGADVGQYRRHLARKYR